MFFWTSIVNGACLAEADRSRPWNGRPVLTQVSAARACNRASPEHPRPLFGVRVQAEHVGNQLPDDVVTASHTTTCGLDPARTAKPWR